MMVKTNLPTTLLTMLLAIPLATFIVVLIGRIGDILASVLDPRVKLA